jgi:hypothetical protein
MSLPCSGRLRRLGGYPVSGRSRSSSAGSGARRIGRQRLRGRLIEPLLRPLGKPRVFIGNLDQTCFGFLEKRPVLTHAQTSRYAARRKPADRALVDILASGDEIIKGTGPIPLEIFKKSYLKVLKFMCGGPFVITADSDLGVD